MSDEQAGPPTEGERERRDIEWLRVTQLRFVEGFRARQAMLHPMRRNAKGDALNTREHRWSYADDVEAQAPKGFPAHEAERWRAGFLHADHLASTLGSAALDRYDPTKPPRKERSAPVAEPLDAFGDEGRMTRTEAREFWRRQRGQPTEYAYRDAGEQE